MIPLIVKFFKIWWYPIMVLVISGAIFLTGLLVKQDFSEKLINQLGQIESLSKPEIKNIEFFIQNELDVKSSRA